MSVEIKMYRNKDAKADFSEWNLYSDSSEIEKAIHNHLEKCIDVIFSDVGANSRISLDAFDSEDNDLSIDCSIELSEFEAYATAKVSLRELFRECSLNFCDRADAENVSNILRSIADSLLVKNKP